MTLSPFPFSLDQEKQRQVVHKSLTVFAAEGNLVSGARGGCTDDQHSYDEQQKSEVWMTLSLSDSDC